MAHKTFIFGAIIFKKKDSSLYATLLVAAPPPYHSKTVRTSVFLFLRKGKRVSLQTYTDTMVPGLSFPVGGITLLPPEINKIKSKIKDNYDQEVPEVVIGNVASITDATPKCGSYSDTIATSITNSKADTCGNVCQGWDLVFAWQPPTAPETLTYNLDYQDAYSQLTEQGFFTTYSTNLANKKEAMRQFSLYGNVNNAWVLGWSVSGKTQNTIKLGLTKELITTNNNFQVKGYLAGVMDDQAKATWSGMDVENAGIVTGIKLPLIARHTGSEMSGQFSQLIIAGRTFSINQDDDNNRQPVTPLQSDQLLSGSDYFGTTIDFETFLHIK